MKTFALLLLFLLFFLSIETLAQCNVTRTITPPSNVCSGQDSWIYYTEPWMTNYTWTVSSGATITFGGTSSDSYIEVTWNTPGPQTISVNYTDFYGCTATSATILNVTVNAPTVSNTATISGNSSACKGSTEEYVTESGKMNYTWTVSGGTIIGPQGNYFINVQWNSPGSRTISVTYSEPYPATCLNSTTIKNVTVNDNPTPTVTGSSSYCLGSGAIIYTTEPGASNYTWALNTGGVITSGQGTNSITVTWTAVGTRQLTVYTQNGTQCSNYASTLITVTGSVPYISGNTIVCQNSSGNTYTTSSQQSNYQWAVSPGGIITSGGTVTSNTVTITWTGVGSNWVSVNYTSGTCQPASPFILNVSVGATPIPTISGSNTVCQNQPWGSVGNVYTTEPGKSNYQWTVTGGFVTSGGGPLLGGSNSATVTWHATGNPVKTISVNYLEPNGSAPPPLVAGCTAPTPTSMNVTFLSQSVPTISGNSIVCQNTPENTYTTEAGKSNYNWTIPATATVTAGGTSTDNSVTLTWSGNVSGTFLLQVSYSDAGCTAFGYKLVMVEPFEVLISGNTDPCTGVPVYYATEPDQSDYSWTVSAGGTITSGGSATDHFAYVRWDSPGAQTVSANFTASNGCTSPSPQVLDVSVAGTGMATITGPVSVCPGATDVAYTAEPGKVAYNWGVTGGTVTSNSSNTITVSWYTSGSISVNTYNGSCWSSAQKNVNIIPPVLPPLTGNSNVCVGTSNVYTTQSGMTNYVWTVSPGATVNSGGTSTSNTIDITWNVVGNGNSLRLSYTDANGCASQQTNRGVNAKVRPVPAIIPSGLCLGPTAYSTESGKSNYVWSTSAGGTITAGGTSTSSSVTVTWNATGDQTVSVNYTNTNGCAAVQPTVTVFPINTPTLSNLNGCLGNGNVYQTQTQREDYEWAVSSGGTITGGGTSTSSNITVNWSTPGPQTVSVRYKTGDCTPASPTIFPITIATPPVPTVSGAENVCITDPIKVYMTEAGMSNYSWNVSGGTINAGGTSSDNTISIEWSTIGNNSLTVGYTNSNGCFGSVVKPTYVKGVATASVEGYTTACRGFDNYFNTSSEGYNYTWSVSPDGVITDVTPNDHIINVKWNTTGSKTVTVNYDHQYYCISPAILNVNVLLEPTPTITGNPTACLNIPGNIYSTEAGQSNYGWYVQGGTITSGQGTNTVTVTWTQSGSHTIQINYTDSNSCSALSSTVKNIFVNDAASIPTISGNPIACHNSSGNAYETESGKTNYAWTIPPDATVTAGGASTDHTITVTWNTTDVGGRYIWVNHTNELGCRSVQPAQKFITIKAKPIPPIDKSYGCHATENVYITTSGQSNYAWNITGGTPNSGGTSTDNSITVIWHSTGPKTVSVNYTDGFGCRAESPTVKSFIVNPQLLPTISGDAGSCPGVINTYYTEPSKVNYEWRLDDALNPFWTSSSAQRAWSTEGTHIVKVSYADINGCRSQTAHKTVEIAKIDQTITFNPFPLTRYGEGPLSPAVSTSGMAISYTSSNLAVATISEGEIQIVGVGTTLITASQPGDACHNASQVISHPLTVNKALQVISFTPNPIPQKTFGDLPFAVSPQLWFGFTSPITYTSSNASVATISGNTITIVGGGTSEISAHKAGNSFYEPATASQTLSVGKKSQTITFGPLSARTVGDVFTVSATASSGLPVSFSSANPSRATVSGNTVTVLTPGTVDIIASQPGNSNYNAALIFSRTLTIYAVPVAVITGPTGICTAPILLLGSTNTPDCSYLWSTGQTTQNIAVTSAGNYQLTVINGAGHSITSAIRTVTNNPPTLTVNGPTSLCPSITTTLTSSGGSSYQWYKNGAFTGQTSAAINISSAGSYYVKVTNPTGCSGTFDSNSVTIEAPYNVSITGHTTFCQGNHAELHTITNCIGCTYSWSNGATTAVQWVYSPGTYTVTVTKPSTGCTISASTQVVEIAPTNGGSISASASCYNGSPILLTASSGDSHEWFKKDVPLNMYSQAISVSSLGNYNVAITPIEGPPVKTGCFDLYPCFYQIKALTDNEETDASVEVFPNPADRELIIRLPAAAEQQTSLHLFDQMGRVVQYGYFDKGEVQKIISTAHYTAGVYLIQINSPKGILRRKVMVVHKN